MFVYELAHLEYRQRGRHLVGKFGYGSTAVIRDRGAIRKERIRPRAFRFSIDSPGHDIDLLRGHSFDHPLGSKLAGSLVLADTVSGVEFDAELPPENRQPSWMVDTVLAVRSGLVRGISPGFRVPPTSAVPNAVEIVPERGNPDVMVREISEGVLYELSLVTRPAYEDTEVDIRQAENGLSILDTPNLERYYRWL